MLFWNEINLNAGQYLELGVMANLLTFGAVAVSHMWHRKSRKVTEDSIRELREILEANQPKG